MTKRWRLLSTIAILTFSGVLMAQMDIAAATPGDKPKTSNAAPRTLTGIVSGSMCGAHHMEKDKSAAECTRECVKQGTKHALVVGKKVHTLEGHEAELDKVAGMKATVKAELTAEESDRES
jgi:hypothetical protein